MYVYHWLHQSDRVTGIIKPLSGGFNWASLDTVGHCCITISNRDTDCNAYLFRNSFQHTFRRIGVRSHPHVLLPTDLS